MHYPNCATVLPSTGNAPARLQRQSMKRAQRRKEKSPEVRAAARKAVAARAAEGRDVLDVMQGAVEAMTPVVEAKMRAFAPKSVFHT